jgi:hypothetical protein
MVAGSLVSVALLLAQQEPAASGPEAVAKMVSEAGSAYRISRSGYGEIFWSCAEVPACAEGCEATLRMLDRELPKPGQVKAGCHWLRQPETLSNTAARAAALPIVLERLRVLSEKIRPRLNARMRDHLDCGLSRMGLATPNAEVCARDEAHSFVTLVEYFAQTPEGEGSRWPLAHACQGLETCAGDCRDEMEIVWSADWSRFEGFDPKRVAAVKRCPEFGHLAIAGPVNETEARLRVWVTKRVKDFAARACKLLDESDRAKVACGLSRLRAPLEASACGPTPTGCQPLPPSRPLPHRRK